MAESKQVIVLRKDLKMRKGKMVAQGSHASMKIFFDLMAPEYGLNTVKNGNQYKYQLWLPEGDVGKKMREWMEGSFAKIVVSVDSLDELEGLYELAQIANIPSAMIIDEGRTEFKGIPTKTCIAIGPDDGDKIDKLTAHLSLL